MSEFVKNFDCKDEEHVMWLKEVGEIMAKVTMGGKADIIGSVNNNPLKNTPTMTSPADWAYIHFQLAMKYANSVLSGDAFIPVKKA